MKDILIVTALTEDRHRDICNKISTDTKTDEPGAKRILETTKLLLLPRYLSMRYRFVVLLALITLTFPSCVTFNYPQMFPGPSLPLSDIAVVQSDAHLEVLIEKVDGESCGFFGRGVVHVLPGLHTFRVSKTIRGYGRGLDFSGTCVFSDDYSLLCVAGQTYTWVWVSHSSPSGSIGYGGDCGSGDFPFHESRTSQ